MSVDERIAKLESDVAKLSRAGYARVGEMAAWKQVAMTLLVSHPDRQLLRQRLAACAKSASDFLSSDQFSLEESEMVQAAYDSEMSRALALVAK